MTHKNQGGPLIANAIVWAALMIATSLIMADAGDDQKMSLMLLQIAGWYAVNLTLRKDRKSLKAEWTCLCRRFGRNEQG